MNTTDHPTQRTEQQKAAARANGAKSRGPVTAEGKSISSRNSLRHGMLAKTVLLEGESLESFQNFMESLEETFHPLDLYEISLLETMALAKWRQMRLVGMEKAAMHHQIQASDPEQPLATITPTDPATRAYLAFTGLSGQNRTLELMNRYESRCDRQYNRALTHLLDSQRRREDAKLKEESDIPPEY